MGNHIIGGSLNTKGTFNSDPTKNPAYITQHMADNSMGNQIGSLPQMGSDYYSGCLPTQNASSEFISRLHAGSSSCFKQGFNTHLSNGTLPQVQAAIARSDQGTPPHADSTQDRYEDLEPRRIEVPGPVRHTNRQWRAPPLEMWYQILEDHEILRYFSNSQLREFKDHVGSLASVGADARDNDFSTSVVPIDGGSWTTRDAHHVWKCIDAYLRRRGQLKNNQSAKKGRDRKDAELRHWKSIASAAGAPLGFNYDENDPAYREGNELMLPNVTENAIKSMRAALAHSQRYTGHGAQPAAPSPQQSNLPEQVEYEGTFGAMQHQTQPHDSPNKMIHVDQFLEHHNLQTFVDGLKLKSEQNPPRPQHFFHQDQIYPQNFSSSEQWAMMNSFDPQSTDYKANKWQIEGSATYQDAQQKVFGSAQQSWAQNTPSLPRQTRAQTRASAHSRRPSATSDYSQITSGRVTRSSSRLQLRQALASRSSPSSAVAHIQGQQSQNNAGQVSKLRPLQETLREDDEDNSNNGCMDM